MALFPTPLRLSGAIAALATLTACTASLLPAERTLPKGDTVSLSQLASAHGGQIACFDYDAGTDSCASIARWTVSGTRFTSRETGAAQGPNGIVRMELIARGTVEGNGACVNPSDISLAGGPDGAAEFALSLTQQVMSTFGGVCSSYYRSGDHYVVSTRGRDGRVFPPGDSRLDFFDTVKAVRAQ